MFHLSGKFLVNLKFVGAFCPPAPSFVVQRVFIEGEEETFCYKHFPLPHFLTRRRLKAWEKEIEKNFPSYTPFPSRFEFLSRWLREAEEAGWVGIGNYKRVEEAVKETPLLVVYEWRGRKLILGKEAFKPVPDRKAFLYLLPCGCFPETVEKLGVKNGSK